MHDNIVILSITIVVLGYGYFSNLFLRFNISGPMVYTTVGLLLSPLGFGITALQINTELVQIVAEVALIIVLFGDASALRIKELKYEWNIPTRLLLIGLPLMIVAATFVADLMFPAETIMYLLLMALVLAPTDAALGKAVVSDKKVPEKIRTGINVESGLNDGIVFPVLITVVAVIANGEHHIQGNGWMLYVAQQISVGAIVGSLVGYFSALSAVVAIQKNWMETNYKNLIPIAIAIISYYLAEDLGGNGFIAAFFSGLFVGNYSEKLREHVQEFAESEGEILILISFMVFGLIFIPATIDYWNLNVFMYALLSLTLLRMVPVAISLIGTKLDLASVLFVGWFGPRGIASILYVLIIVSKLGSIKGHEAVYAVITVTVLLSIFLHGLSAQPLVNLFAKSHKDQE